MIIKSRIQNKGFFYANIVLKYSIKIIVPIIFFNTIGIFSQVTLNADGPGNTYELINSVLAPRGNVVEAPDDENQVLILILDVIFQKFLIPI